MHKLLIEYIFYNFVFLLLIIMNSFFEPTPFVRYPFFNRSIRILSWRFSLSNSSILFLGLYVPLGRPLFGPLCFPICDSNPSSPFFRYARTQYNKVVFDIPYFWAHCLYPKWLSKKSFIIVIFFLLRI